jgi:hypothetical protein
MPGTSLTRTDDSGSEHESEIGDAVKQWADRVEKILTDEPALKPLAETTVEVAGVHDPKAPDTFEAWLQLDPVVDVPDDDSDPAAGLISVLRAAFQAGHEAGMRKAYEINGAG